MEELWTANKYIKEPTGDGGKTRIPTLKYKQADGTMKNIDTNEGKTEALAQNFFPSKPLVTSVPEDYNYPDPLPDPPPISKEQIRDQIRRLSPYKASGPDGIPNVVLQQSISIIEEYLLHIYRATLTLRTYIDSWREFTTIVLRKPNKPNYEVAKAYRPIALLSTMSKVLTAIIADEISRTVERELLLPENHYGGRAGRMTTDAVHILEDKIKSAWRKGKVVSVLFLNVEGAFPNAVTDRLIHNLRKWRIPEIHVEFIHNLLQGRRTKLKFDDFVSALIFIFNGIGQGDPLSMILYILYNADLLELARTPEEDSLGFVDDALGLAIGKTFQDTTKTLKDFMDRPATGGFRWGHEHNSKYEIDKLAVVHFTCQREADPQHPGKTQIPKHPRLKLQGKIIKDVESYKYLGIHIDRQLQWKTQMQKTISKATSYVLLFRRLTKHSTGIPAKLMRRLYLSVAVPKMMYGLDIWYTPPYQEEGKRRKTGSVKALKEFTKIQRIATLAITGALRTTPNELLDAHAGVLPIDLLLRKVCYRALMRISSLPETNPASLLAVQYYIAPVSKHKTSVQHLINIFKFNPLKTETIPPKTEPPTTIRKYQTICAQNKQEAEQQEDNDKARTKIYTDGSCHNGQVGAAAVEYVNGEPNPRRIIRYRLGSQLYYTSNDAEIVGGILGCWMMNNSPHLGAENITLYTDSQYFLNATQSTVPQTGHHLIQYFNSLARELYGENRPAHAFTMQWIPGHGKSRGNRRADEEAKKAALGDTTRIQQLPPELKYRPLPHSAKALKAAYMNELTQESALHWSISKRKPNFETNIDNTYPFNKFRQIQSSLTHAKASILMQICTGHIPLNAYLFRFGKHHTPRCNACYLTTQRHKDETIRHYLFECPEYRWERADMDKALGRNSRDMRILLSNEKNVKVLLKYIGKTKRLKTTPGEVPPQPNKNNG